MPSDGTLVLIVEAIFVIATAVAVAWDVATYEIPDMASVALTAGFAAGCLFGGLDWGGIATHVATAAAILVCGVVCHGRGWWGGGDVKFSAALALWFGWPMVTSWLVYMSLLGAALAILLLAFRRVPLGAAPPAWLARLHAAHEGVPYGLALGGAALFMRDHAFAFLPAAG